ncbi:MAG: hypothetical protein WD801_12220 [Gemmatimonadaceae bacterium]
MAAAGTARPTKIAGFHVDVAPRKTLIVLTNRDVSIWSVRGRVGGVAANEVFDLPPQSAGVAVQLRQCALGEAGARPAFWGVGYR